MKGLIAAALFMIIPYFAQAEDWIDISDNSGNMAFDKDSIKSRYDADGNLIVSMWVLTINGEPMMHENGIGIMMLQTANCTDMSFKLSEMAEIDEEGEVIWRLSQDPSYDQIAEALPMEYYYPTPGDKYANNLNTFCHPSIIKYGFENEGF